MSRATKRRAAQDARRQQAYTRAKAQRPAAAARPPTLMDGDGSLTAGPPRRGLMRVLGLARWQRVLLALLFTAGWALLAVPVVVRTPVRPFDPAGGGAWASTVGISVFGLVMYGVGWWLLVGERGRTPTPHPAQLGAYLLTSAVALALGLAWAWSVVGAVL